MGFVELDKKNISANTCKSIYNILNNKKYVKYYLENGELPRDFYYDIFKKMREELQLEYYIKDLDFEDENKLLFETEDLLMPAGYSEEDKTIIINPKLLNRLSEIRVEEYGCMSRGIKTKILENLYALEHEIEHANQYKKRFTIKGNEGKLLRIVTESPFTVYKDEEKAKKKKDITYIKLYDINLRERLANYYAGLRMYLIGYYTLNMKMKKMGLRKMYKSLMMGYGEGSEQCKYQLEVDDLDGKNKIIEGPTLKYISELLDITGYNAYIEIKRLFPIDEMSNEEKMKLGLYVEDGFLEKEKQYYKKIK